MITKPLHSPFIFQILLNLGIFWWYLLFYFMTLRREYNQYVSHASPQRYYSLVSDMLMPEYANTQTSIPSPGAPENAPHHT